MTVKATTVKFTMVAEEILSATEAPAATAQNRTVRHNQWDRTYTGSPTTDPKVDVPAYLELAATDTGTIDLTALDTLEGVVDCTGKRIVALSIRNLGDDDFELVEGASNGYTINDAAGAFLVKPGEHIQKWFADQGPTVSGTVKTLDWDNAGDQPVRLAIHLGDAT